MLFTVQNLSCKGAHLDTVFDIVKDGASYECLLGLIITLCLDPQFSL